MTDDPTSAIGTSLSVSGVLALLGWMYLKGKFDSVGLLWRKYDELKDTLTAQRLADAKEYATRVEVASALDKLEVHIDKRFNALEDQIKELKT